MKGFFSTTLLSEHLVDMRIFHCSLHQLGLQQQPRLVERSMIMSRRLVLLVRTYKCAKKSIFAVVSHSFFLVVLFSFLRSCSLCLVLRCNQAEPGSMCGLQIVTGKGRNSRTNDSPIRAAVLKFLQVRMITPCLHHLGSCISPAAVCLPLLPVLRTAMAAGA